MPRFCTRWYSDTMKRIGFIFALLTLVLTLSAVPADEYWQLFYQPDGTAIELCLVGDEHERHYEDRNGFVYEQNTDGAWIRLSPTESERQIARRRQASPLSQFPRRIGEVNLAPRGLVILANYSNIAFDALNDLAGMTDMLNGDDYTYEDATGSARRYFMDQSGGQYAPWFDVVGPVTLDNPRAYYGANNGSSLDVQASQMIVDACRKADEAGVDFTRYDNDKDGIIWPRAIAPFEVVVVPVNSKVPEQLDLAEQIYSELKAAGVDVLLDDRKERAGVKFKDCDLIGYPLRVTVGPKTVEEGTIELRVRKTGETFVETKDNYLAKVLELVEKL